MAMMMIGFPPSPSFTEYKTKDMLQIQYLIQELNVTRVTRGVGISECVLEGSFS